MYIPNLKWSAEAILEVVAESELVMIQKERYLGVWYGDFYASVYDLKAHPSIGFVMVLLTRNTVNAADMAITEYIDALEGDIPEDDLTIG